MQTCHQQPSCEHELRATSATAPEVQHRAAAGTHLICSMEPSATWMRAPASRQPWHQACRQSRRTKAVPRCSSRHTPQLCSPSAKARCSSSALYLQGAGQRRRSIVLRQHMQQAGRRRTKAMQHQHPTPPQAKQQLCQVRSPQQLEQAVLGALLIASACCLITLTACCTAAAASLLPHQLAARLASKQQRL